MILSRVLCLSMGTCGWAVAAHGAPAGIDRAPLAFAVVVDGSCTPQSQLSDEAAALAVLAGEIAAKTLVSVVSGALEDAGKDRTVTRLAVGAGQLYLQDKDANLSPNTDALCIRYWYGRRGVPADNTLQRKPDESVQDAAVEYLKRRDQLGWEAVDEPLLAAWVNLGLVEAPFVYGEFAIAASTQGTALNIETTRFFARPAPDLKSGWGSEPTYTITLELSSPGSDKPFAIHAFGLPGSVEGPVSLEPAALLGSRSAWFAAPSLDKPPKDGAAATGRFSAKVMLTAAQPGSRFAKALGAAVSGSSDALVKALTPKKTVDSKATNQQALAEVLDSELAVAEAEQELAAAEDAKKPAAAMKVKKAQFLVNVKREAAGLPAKYDVPF